MAVEEDVDRIRAEALQIRRAALISAERHFAAESPWFRMVYWLGLPAAVLSAIASAAAFTQVFGGWLAGIVSLVVVIITTLMTVLNPQERASKHHALAIGYEGLYRAAGFFYRIESLNPKLDAVGREQALKALVTMQKALNDDRPPVEGKAYAAADENLKKGYGEVARDPDDRDPIEITTGQFGR
jgi:hypothetical protein